MSDPLSDPRFPDRPQHPDFWRLSSALTKADGDATEGDKSVEEIVGVDGQSLVYVANNRVGMGVVAHGSLTRTVAVGLWIDGFQAGKAFFESRNSDRPKWPVNDEERAQFQEWTHDVGEGNTHLGFRDWLDNQDDA